jgi:hypothetical protein
MKSQGRFMGWQQLDPKVIKGNLRLRTIRLAGGGDGNENEEAAERGDEHDRS